MNKTLFLIIGLFILSICACEQKKDEIPPPNILWLVSEDNSPFIGAYGDQFATTPHLDSLAAVGVLYENAFAAAPVCAPTRSTIITGMYANSLGTENMRSGYSVPDFVDFYPKFLNEAGYYCTNNSKKDYNTVDQPEVWYESSGEATYRNRQPGQRFFHIQNFGVSHEGQIHKSTPTDELMHDPGTVPIPPYHPRTPEMEHDWAQYYDQVSMMDEQIGEFLAQLHQDGLADSTIIFYYSDHGGVLARSKRFMYESGLHVPLIVYFPPMYQHLAPVSPGSPTDRLVSFVDFPPTLLSLAGIQIPEHMQGKAFLGDQKTEPRDYTYSFRGRMDERIDLVRSVRSKNFRYVRNYMPHKIYGQYIEYLWRAPSMRSWEAAFKAGELNEIQSKFWLPKPAEELYDVRKDPHNVQNLVDDPQYAEVLSEMRNANQNWLQSIQDVGFLPEAMMLSVNQEGHLYEYAQSEQYEFDKILEAAETSTLRDPEKWDQVMSFLEDDNAVVRYWGMTGCVILNEQAKSIVPKIKEMAANDPEISVRIAAAEALYGLQEVDEALSTLIAALDSDNMMARVQALNVLELMGEAAKPALNKVREIIPEDPQNRNYDIRAGRRLLDKFETSS